MNLNVSDGFESIALIVFEDGIVPTLTTGTYLPGDFLILNVPDSVLLVV